MKKLDFGLLLRVLSFTVLISSLLCLCIVGVYARYTSSAEGGLAFGVARWDISVGFTGESTVFTLADEEGKRTAEYSFFVTSRSEVVVSYDVVLTLPEALEDPDSLSFAIENVFGHDILPSVSENGLVYTFSDHETFQFGTDGGTKEHTLKITTSNCKFSMSKSGITVQVVARQLD